MARKSNKRSVPGVLWRMFRHRARTLSDTVTSLLPPPPKLCRCDGRCCLGCTLDAKSFLLRPDDPSDYHKLLTQCYVVVSENAPSLPFFAPLSGLSQDQVVKRTIEQMLHRREPAVSNVLCSGYDRIKCSSRTVELLSSASWSLLLSRVGDDFMIYLLRNTSIFLPAPLGNHHQVGGEQKRKRTDADDLPVEKRKCHISGIINGPLGFSSNLGMTDKSSMQLIRHHRSRNYDVSVSEVPKLIRTETVIRKSESEGNQGSNCITPRLGKRSRPFSWQRRRCKMLKQLTLEENSLNIQPNTSSLSYHAEDNISGKNLHEKCVDTLEAISSLSDGFKSYCSKSQVDFTSFRIVRYSSCMENPEEKYFKVHTPTKNRNDAMHVVKRKLLEKWIFWYFSCLVVPLLQANFYVTEIGKGRHDIYYYAKPVWEKLVANTIVCFKGQRYSCLDDVVVHNILRDRRFGFSKLRLQPKEDGVRMVANLKGSSTMPLSKSTIGVQNWRTKGKLNHQKIMYKRYLSVNSVLRDAHSILRGILFGKTDKLGSSVFDYDDVYKKLCPFLVGQKKKTGTMPNLFIITSDVVQAFDSIDQNHLLSIVENVLVKDEYFLKQYHQVMCTKKSLWVQKHFMMSDETSNNGHTRFTPFKSFQSRHSVFVNQERCKLVKKKVLFSDLTEHVKHNVLQFNGKFYLQDVGIPQGGVLSSLLCSMYYGHLEKHVIFPFLEKTLESGCCKENNDGQTNCPDKVSSSSYMLMRFLDDFLFISTSKRQADSFFSRLQRGFRGYNCYMNEKKFGANFDIEQISGSSLNRVYVGEDGATSFLRWSGLLINCSTMEIQADYTKLIFT
ncbi:hypothetical protein V8G54_025437 [Vigna mungo]|uniref:Telomerase reverse transcriptase n=1 Tax=Vigna mungo TaxID=3915 RepID=A0AAQ3MYF5_VIGMU